MPAFQDPEIYHDILDHLQIGVSVLDLQNKIVFWSDGAEHLTGYARIDVLGHSCMPNILRYCNQLSGESFPEKCPIATALHDAKPVEAAGFIYHKTGHRAPVHTWSIPLRDRRGSMIGIIQTFEGEFAATGQGPNDQSMRERGCIDELTGLPNQAMMHAHLKETLRSFLDLHIPFGIICVETDGLGRFRARCGQEAVTSMLRVLARSLRNTVWPTDFVGRWSDNQFLVILSGCGEDAVQVVSNRVLSLLSGATIHWWGEELSMPVLIGHAAAQPGDSLESLLLRAQHELGKNQAAGAAAPQGAHPMSRS
jgi:diguanylate cyclase (GGDEF)-like protein/PAS domain S-box-containing protein